MSPETKIVKKSPEVGVDVYSTESTENHIFGLSITHVKAEDYISLSINVAEFIREDPLEEKFRNNIIKAIEGIDGVKSVEEEDREVWSIEGNADTTKIIGEVVGVISELYQDIKNEIENI